MTLALSREFVDDGELDVVEGVRRIEDADLLRVVEALAHEKIVNIELKHERDRLKRRIDEENARLSHV